MTRPVRAPQRKGTKAVVRLSGRDHGTSGEGVVTRQRRYLLLCTIKFLATHCCNVYRIAMNFFKLTPLPVGNHRANQGARRRTAASTSTHKTHVLMDTPRTWLSARTTHAAATHTCHTISDHADTKQHTSSAHDGREERHALTDTDVGKALTLEHRRSMGLAHAALATEETHRTRNFESHTHATSLADTALRRARNSYRIRRRTAMHLLYPTPRIIQMRCL